MRRLCLLVMIAFFVISVQDKVYAYDSYEVGEIVTYNNDNWYVIKDSSNEDNYVTLLKVKALTAEEISKYGGQVQDLPSGYDGSEIDYDACSYIDNVSYYIPGDDCGTDYDTSNVKTVIDNWINASIPENDLIDVNGLKARLLTIDDLKENLGYEWIEEEFAFLNHFGPSNNKVSKLVYSNKSNLPFWLGTSSTDMENGVYVIDNNGNTAEFFVVKSPAKVRPVINLRKEALENINSEDSIEVNENRNDRVCRTEKRMVPIFPKYKVGDVVSYNNQSYLVIENSTEKKEYVTLLKIEPLTSEEISKYYEGATSIDDSIGVTAYSNSQEYWTYDDSNVKSIIDSWVQDKGLTDLVITNYEINSAAYLYPDIYDIYGVLSEFGYTKYNGPQTLCSTDGYCQTIEGDPYNPTLPTPSWFNKSVARYIHSNTTPTWLYDAGYDYWIYSGSNITRNSHYIMGRNGDVGMVGETHNLDGDIVSVNGTNKAAVRPTINVSKSLAFGENKAFQRGDVVNYKGIDFYVLEDSPANNDILILLKQTPLTQGEINKYTNASQNIYDDNAIQYKSGCTYYGECSTDYNSSDIKKVVDAWTEANIDLEKLVLVKGYKSRIISIDDLVDNLGYELKQEDTFEFLNKTEDTPVEVYESGEKYWTMTGYEDSNRVVYYYSAQSTGRDVAEKYKVRPVINLYKCELGNCQYEEKLVEVCDKDIPEEKKPFLVIVGNTLMNPNGIIILLSSILIVCGIIVVVRIYKLGRMHK